MVLDNVFPPDVRVENEALSLLQAGHEVFLFSLDFNGRSGVEDHRGIRVVRYPAGTILYKLSALAYTLPFYHWRTSSLISDFLDAYDVQVMHVHDLVIAAAAFDANRKFKLPVVLDYHENRPEIMRDYRHVRTFSGRILIDLKRWSQKYYDLASLADRVIVVTEAAKQDIVQQTGKVSGNVIVVPNTVKPADFSRHAVNENIVARMDGFFNIVYIGDTSLRRGTDTAIRAFAAIVREVQNARLWFVGKSSADGELKALSTGLGISDSVMFEGWQAPELLSSYLQHASVALSPLKRNRHHDTTYANKIFQYMVMGVPVVVSDCTAQAELVAEENCGLVHRADEPESLAQKILFLQRNPDTAAELGQRGKQAVLERWNWDITSKGLVQMYGVPDIGNR